MTLESSFHRFIAQIDHFSEQMSQKTQAETNVFKEKDRYIGLIKNDFSTQEISQKVHEDNPLKYSILEVAKKIEKTITFIESESQDLKKRIQLQSEYQDKLIIIIFGKVNAGKSSFTNYIVQNLAAELCVQPKMFELIEGKKQEFLGEKFKEGATETTTSIQGVEIGNLVLLDSPGLHSVNDDNGNLAKNYTESANLILWLTSSSSPGQIQELDSLKHELNKQKVLIPVISKSDFEEEDEVDGDLIKVLDMKKTEVQKAQQDDVYARTINCFTESDLNQEKLKKPCSISVRYANSYADQSDIFQKSGFNELFENIGSVYDQVLESNIKNIKIQSDNYIKKVRASLDDVSSVIEETLNEIASIKTDVYKTSDDISNQLLIELQVRLPDLVANAITNAITNKDKLKAKKQILAGIQSFMETKLAELVNNEFNRIFKSLTRTASNGLDSKFDINAEIEDIEYTYYETSGMAAKAATAGGGGLAGAAAGAAIGSAFPVIGTFVGSAIGGILGGLSGGAVGDNFVERIAKTEVIGPESTKVEEELLKQISQTTPEAVNQVVVNLMKYITPLENRLLSVKNNILEPR